MSAPRLFFLNRFYWPEHPATGQLLTDLAEALAAEGFEVTVLTSGPSQAPRDESRHGVRIQRIRTPRGAGQGALGKAFSWLSFGLGAAWRTWRTLRPGDTLIVLTDPPLLNLLTGPLARRRHARVIHWVQDIYPELPERLSRLRGLGVIRRLRNREWRQTDTCVTLGDDMQRFILRQGVPADQVRIVPNWGPHGLVRATPDEVARQRAEWRLEGKFIVAYSGNMGRVHDLDPILAVARQLLPDAQIVFLFIGNGAQRPRLEAEVKAAKLTNIRFLPPQPRAYLSASLTTPDVHLVTLRPGCEELVFPSKLYGILAVGRPVLYIGPTACELARQIQAGGYGAAFAGTETTAMAATLSAWKHDPARLAGLGDRGAALAHTQGGLASATQLWQELLRARRP